MRRIQQVTVKPHIYPYGSMWICVGLLKQSGLRRLFCEDKKVTGYGYSPLQAFNAFASMKQEQYNIDCGK